MALAASPGNRRGTLRILGNEVFTVIVLPMTGFSFPLSHLQLRHFCSHPEQLQLCPHHLQDSNLGEDTHQYFGMLFNYLLTTNGCIVVGQRTRNYNTIIIGFAVGPTIMRVMFSAEFVEL